MADIGKKQKTAGTPSRNEAAARGYSYAPARVPPDFPVVEVFGFPPDCRTPAAQDARSRCWCPFMGRPCAKLLSPAQTGICSIRYQAEGFASSIAWATCEHRLKGPPFREAMKRHFGRRAPRAQLVTELRLSEPRMSLDGVGALLDANSDHIDVVGIEAQTIDTRGGQIKPLWAAYVDGQPDRWRDRYLGGVKFGVNTTNVWKRLLPQVMNKGRLYRGWDSRLYVVVQDPVFQFISRRMRLDRLPRQQRDQAEIIWLLWDFDGDSKRDPQTGMLRSGISADAIYTTVQQVEEAFVRLSITPRNEFIEKLRRKLDRVDRRQP
jgi:hypothetical protein